ncbi:hypothetical protein [Amycolatopsis sp. cg9]|uniref:hypothetical protein n=1 Tax=Amycolatopsis sp. cg9 TaxID=3238801 RepID=UPI00352344F6
MPARPEIPPNGSGQGKLYDLILKERDLSKEAKELHARLFDQETALMLRGKLDDLLSTISSIATDDNLWSNLADPSKHAPLSLQEIEKITSDAPLALPYILKTWGYSTPPPPPAEDLVNETVGALRASLSFQGDRRTAAQEARWQVITFEMRVRRQIPRLDNHADTTKLTNAVLTACTRARQLILPIGSIVGALVGATGRALTENADPRTIEAVSTIAEQGARFGLTTLTGLLTTSDTSPQRTLAPVNLTEQIAVATHLHAVVDILQSRSSQGEEYGRLMRAERHARRAYDLASRLSRKDSELPSAIQNLRSKLKEASKAHRTGRRDLKELYKTVNVTLYEAYEIATAQERSRPSIVEPRRSADRKTRRRSDPGTRRRGPGDFGPAGPHL